METEGEENKEQTAEIGNKKKDGRFQFNHTGN